MEIPPQADRLVRPKDVAIAIWPTSLIDAAKIHYLTEGALTIAIVAVANPQARELKSAWLSFDLPSAVDLVGTDRYLDWQRRTEESIHRDGKDYRRFRIPCAVEPVVIPRGKSGDVYYSRYRPPAIWLRSNSPITDGRLYARLDYVAIGETQEKSCPEISVGLRTLPPIAPRHPTLTSSGVMGRFILTGDAALGDQVAEYIKQLGYNLLVGGLPTNHWPSGLLHWKEAPIQNGFEIRGRPIPPESQYLLNGSRVTNAVIPSVLYQPKAWTDRLFADLSGEISGHTADGWMMNLEPERYIEHGDESKESEADFIRWSSLDADLVAREWPDQLRKEHSQEWSAFQNWQVHQVISTLGKVVGPPKNDHPPPMAIWVQNGSFYGYAKSPLDLSQWGDLPLTVLTWQYYFIPAATGPFPIFDQSCAVQVVRTARMVRVADSRLGLNRALQVGCVYGWDQTAGRDGFFTPEQLSFLHLSSALAGAPVALNYSEFPVWDGRYAAAIAETNDRISRWENFTLRGKKDRRHVVIPVSPYPQTVPANVRPEQQELPSDWFVPGYVFSFEYTLGDRRLIVIANTWDRGDVFVKLRVFTAPGGQLYTVSQPEENRVFSSYEGKIALTSQQLSDGTIVHIGATRWAAFLVQPAGAGSLPPKYEVITPSLMAQVERLHDDRLRKTLPSAASFKMP